MNTTLRRVARLEAAAGQPRACKRCAGRWIGVVFSTPGPDDYGPYPDGRPGPLPPECPVCGRAMPKHYLMPDRAAWNALEGL